MKISDREIGVLAYKDVALVQTNEDDDIAKDIERKERASLELSLDCEVVYDQLLAQQIQEPGIFVRTFLYASSLDDTNGQEQHYLRVCVLPAGLANSEHTLQIVDMFNTLEILGYNFS